MTTISSLEGIAPLTLRPAGEAKAGEASISSTGADFGNILKSMVEKTNNAQLAGEQAIQTL